MPYDVRLHSFCLFVPFAFIWFPVGRCSLNKANAVINFLRKSLVRNGTSDECDRTRHPTKVNSTFCSRPITVLLFHHFLRSSSLLNSTTTTLFTILSHSLNDVIYAKQHTGGLNWGPQQPTQSVECDVDSAVRRTSIAVFNVCIFTLADSYKP